MSSRGKAFVHSLVKSNPTQTSTPSRIFRIVYRILPFFLTPIAIAAYLLVLRSETQHISPEDKQSWKNPEPNALAHEFSLPLLRFRGDTPSHGSGLRYAYRPTPGQTTILHFWATWCSVCKDEAKNFQDLSAALRSAPVNFLGISTDDTVTEILTSETTKKFEFPILFDPDGAIADKYQVKSLPTTLVIGPLGRVNFRITQPIHPSTVKDLASDIIAISQTPKNMITPISDKTH